MGESDYLIALEKLKQFDIVLVTDRLAEGQCVLHSVSEELFKKGVRKSNNSDKKRFDWESCTEMKERILQNYDCSIDGCMSLQKQSLTKKFNLCHIVFKNKLIEMYNLWKI